MRLRSCVNFVIFLMRSDDVILCVCVCVLFKFNYVGLQLLKKQFH